MTKTEIIGSNVPLGDFVSWRDAARAGNTLGQNDESLARITLETTEEV